MKGSAQFFQCGLNDTFCAMTPEVRHEGEELGQVTLRSDEQPESLEQKRQSRPDTELMQSNSPR